jgi:DNA ligase 1
MPGRASLVLYKSVAESYSRLEETSGRNEIVEILAELLKDTPKEEIPTLVYLTQGKLRPDYEGVELGVAEKMALRALATASGKSSDDIRRAYVRSGDIGNAAEEVLATKAQETLGAEPLTLARVYGTLLRIAQTSGEGSVETKQRELISLLNDGSPKEARYIMRTVTGVLRLGVADYTVMDACSSAFLGGKEQRGAIEKAYNVRPDMGYIVHAVAVKGLAGVEGISMEVGVPIRPMLAERMESAEAIVEKLGNKKVVAEFKLDGERLQIHKRGEEVKLFSRRLEVITSHYPDAVGLVKAHVSARKAILEAEVVAINEESGEYLPFQELMHRRRKHGIAEAVEKYPISLNFFDLLMAGSKEYAGLQYTERRRKLEEVVEPTTTTRLVPATTTDDPARIEEFMEEAITSGCEGLVVKDPSSTYRAGAREFAWIKLKREYRSELTDTIDLTIIGAFHGKGRRTGAYGTFLLAAYDSKRDIFTSVAKIGTGFTDEDLAKLPKVLKPFASAAKPPGVETKMVPDVWFRPHVVIETIASELTLSPIHTAAIGRIRPGAGLSLRFPKFTGRIRDDKGPKDGTTVDEVVDMYKSQLKRISSDSAS